MAFTKIIATIGPATIDEAVFDDLVDAGMNCVRINTAHGDEDQYREILRLADGADVATMLDIKGPELRFRAEEPVRLDEGSTLRVSFHDAHLPRINYDVYDDVQVGDTVFFDEGYVETTVVTKHEERAVTLRAEHEATIKPGKGVNIPGKELSLPALSEQDKESIRFAREHDVDYIAQSFVRRSEDIDETREHLSGDPTKIIAKIENHEGVENLTGIIEASDGVMIARGDLGVELPQERIPALQKRIVRKAAQRAGVSIVATQMLESMTEKPKPTRAEVSDVANAVLDGADAVMLSGETAIGSYPVRAVQTMRSVASEIEADVQQPIDVDDVQGISEDMSTAAYAIGQQSYVDKIVVLGSGTKQTRLLTRYRLAKEVIAVTDAARVARQLNLVWGVEPVLVDTIPDEFIIPTMAKHVYDEGLIDYSDTVVFYAGVGTHDHEAGNLVEAHHISEFLSYHGLLE